MFHLTLTLILFLTNLITITSNNETIDVFKLIQK